jgi:LysR family hydrogen peroxide-inducible transcriptional activator
MTLTELRYIVAVARERHFGRAAETCYVSQPTLSVAVKKLEEELGVALFERGPNEVTVTAVGEEIVAQAQRVLEEASRIRQISSQQSDQLSGPLRIGAIYTIGPYLFPEIVPMLAEQAPDLRLAIEENFTSVLTEKLKQGDLDVIIVALPYTEGGIETRPIYDEDFVLLIPSSHPLAKEKRDINRTELADEPVLLLGKGHCFREQVIDYCPECYHGKGAHSLRGIEGGSLETIRYMVASGLGLTVLPCAAAGADRFSQKLIEVRRFADKKQPQRTVVMAWRKSFTRPHVIELLYQSIQACLPDCVSSVPYHKK